jgi:hypothetical protein
MEEENISKQESLQIIESMINKAKNQFSENGTLYLLWGWWVFICSLAQFYLLNVMQYEKNWVVWWSVWIILIYQIFYLRKKRNRYRVRTYTDEIIGFVWITFFILIVLLVFILTRINDPKTTALIDPAFLVLYGMPTFLSGIILKFRPLIIGGICCWILSVICSFIAPEYHLLMIPIAMLAAWIIPGYLLRRKFKASNQDVIAQKF